METMEMTTAAAAAGKPGYKLTKLGWIPEEWDITTLADIVDPERNITYGIVQAGPHVEDGVPYIKTGDLSAEIIPETLSRTSHEIAQQYSRSEVYPGDIVFSLRGDVGASRIVPIDLPVANLTQGTARIAVLDESDRDFVFQQIGSPDVAKRLLDQAKGSTFQEITLKALRLFSVAWPPDRERTAIAEILTSFDKVTRNLSDLLIAKRTYKSGLMQQLLTGQKRFPEFQEQPWREVKLGEVFERVQRPYRAGVDTILSISSKKGFVHQSEKFSRVVAGDTLKRYTLLERGEFSYNKGNSDLYPCGCIYKLEEHKEAAVPNVYISFRNSAPELVDSNFYQHYFLNRMLDAQLTKRINSGVRNDGLLNLNPEDFFEVLIHLPPLPEQQRIAAVLTACGQEIELLQAQLRQWQQQKKGLMQQLLTGQLRIMH